MTREMYSCLECKGVHNCKHAANGYRPEDGMFMTFHARFPEVTPPFGHIIPAPHGFCLKPSICTCACEICKMTKHAFATSTERIVNKQPHGFKDSNRGDGCEGGKCELQPASHIKIQVAREHLMIVCDKHDKVYTGIKPCPYCLRGDDK